MTERRSVFSGGLKLGLNEIGNHAGFFVRSVVLARLLSPEDFGLAATFTLTFSLLQMISNLAAEMLLVQAENGDEPSFQGTAHLLQAFRGIVIGLILLVSADRVALLFGVPDSKWAFQILALAPLIKSLAHTDMFRFQRSSQFGPFISANIWSTFVTTAVSLPLALWLRTYAVTIWLLLLQATCITVASHLVAARPYRWAWNQRHVNQMFAFGWPLLINGVLMFLIFQGDRLVIGVSERLFSRASYSLGDLAVYSLAFSVAQLPALLVANVCTSLFLPMLSRGCRVRTHFEQEYLACSIIVCLAAASTSGPLMLAGGWLIKLIYGAKYSSTGSMILWLAAMQAVRIIRVTPTLGAIALGDTKNAMMSNAIRTPAFALVLLAAATGRPLPWIAACGLAGELFALAYCLWRLWSRHGVPIRLCLGPCAVVAVGLSVAAAAHGVGLAELGGVVTLVASAVLVGAVFSVMLVAYPPLRRDLQSLVAW